VVIGAAASGVGLRDALLIPAGLAVLVAAAAGVLSPHGTLRKVRSGRLPPPARGPADGPRTRDAPHGVAADEHDGPR
jgi:hypothetical protein